MSFRIKKEKERIFKLNLELLKDPIFFNYKLEQEMNGLARAGIPFLFIIDFETKSPIVLPIREAASAGIYFDINGFSNAPHSFDELLDIQFSKKPMPFERYKEAFELVHRELMAGNSYLTNLTFPTPIDLNIDLSTLFQQNKAKYRLLLDDQFTVFSPECFVKINGQRIYSYPMKGTIDAQLPNAATKILQDPKEKAEHFTIVDLIRNDLAMVAKKVRVERFRYIDRVVTNSSDLLQVSSVISGQLPINYSDQIGSIICRLLPAGSISGAPKAKTLDIIRAAEGYERGYYTGIFGYYANGFLESAVMIRFIEKQADQLVFKSGGGITINSEATKEYQELIHKVYVPIAGKYKNQRWSPPQPAVS